LVLKAASCKEQGVVFLCPAPHPFIGIPNGIDNCPTRFHFSHPPIQLFRMSFYKKTILRILGWQSFSVKRVGHFFG